MNLFDDLPEEICRRNVDLAPLTWFKLGGPARFFITPRDDHQLATVVHRCRETDTPLRILGLGANVLVPDAGVDGVVVRLESDWFRQMNIEGDQVVARGGTELTTLVKVCVRKGKAGVEQLAGIPGTVGGGICMNCGGRYGDISSAVQSVRVIRGDGSMAERTPGELAFRYRRCNLQDDVVVEATLSVNDEDPSELDARFREIWAYKQESQPTLGEQSVGCIYRNPDGHSAGQLIDQAGLKGFRIGSAYVSERHANFAIADRGGNATDVRKLIETVIDRVADHCGIRLEPEVKIW